ncbi:hypothetical protein DSM106972_098510 [Dulcicalothrix desertica PCC 7102]|uniref:Uncharacterized protein n=1 Tax=Dulcicalothrix desertica PCC 7102 TaxID=232991 RepID=A0A433UFN9_9CYAN|nr:hypothetical protein [Dulcicalothrix desertica]RUS92677.1 hypothetical protein DSM106972_098510 [Dulcicalothrix desertica PCC 7102]TWH61378.1 hypothetical protein CAL7102_00934 [Dulcicalothrix desertica PCC 7102]
MSGNINWSQAQQLDSNSGLWFKFGKDNNGNWHILSSGDKDSLEKNSVTYHTHHWQSNGQWYSQGRRGNKHTIGKDGLIEGITRQNQTGRLDLTEAEKQELNLTNEEEHTLTHNEVKKLADYRARQAYGNAGYGGTNHGVEVDSNVAEILNKQVQPYQTSTQPKPSLTWRDEDITTASVSESSTKTLTWRDEDSTTTSEPITHQQNSSKKTRKSTRRNTR